LHKKRHIALILSTILIIFQNITARVPEFKDTIPETVQDTALLYSPLVIEDPAGEDTLKTETKKTSEASIDAEIVYTARDSMIYGVDSKKVYLYGEGSVTYMDKELKADYIEYDMSSNIVFAKGMPDSTGAIRGRPLFKDAALEFEAQTMRYNFRTRKGFIEAIKTEQEGGYLHSTITKQDQFGNINMKHGKYTTCDLDNPHFYVALTKAKSIPGDKIVSGPAYLVIEDVPFPIGIPFGFFPNTKTNTSGILIPQYGEEARRGFYLRNGGYYFALNDYLNFTLTGDIYTNGTW